MLLGAYGSFEARMGVALAAYAAYMINAGQFVWKLRMARLESTPPAGHDNASSKAVPA